MTPPAEKQVIEYRPKQRGDQIEPQQNDDVSVTCYFVLAVVVLLGTLKETVSIRKNSDVSSGCFALLSVYIHQQHCVDPLPCCLQCTGRPASCFSARSVWRTKVQYGIDTGA